MQPQVMVDILADLGALGFVMWLVHRTMTHTIPEMAKSFLNAVQSIQATFEEMFKLQRTDFERIVQREQAFHEEQTNKVVQALEDLARHLENRSDNE